MCLTPWISGATFIIEMVIAGWLFSRAKSTKSWLSFLIVIFLALYQASEYGLCLTNNQWWNLIGYSSVTWLPALGFDLVSRQTKSKCKTWPWYCIASLFTVGMIAAPFLLPIATCDPLFTSYFKYPAGYPLYTVYYMGTIALSIWLLSAHWSKARSKTDRRDDAVLLVGFLSFVIPAYWIKFTVPFLKDSFPSVFCFFAVFFAASLVVLGRLRGKGNKKGVFV